MRQRCQNPKNKNFKNYGARGICVCERWMNSFQAFLEDVGPRPSPRHSLGRKENDGHYEPGNVSWETPVEQQNNTRQNRVIEAFGEAKNLTEWAREKNIPVDTLWRRLEVNGWDPERALSTPVREKGGRLTKIVQSAGYPTVMGFLNEHRISPASFYKLLHGKPVGTRLVAKLCLLLKVDEDTLRGTDARESV